MTERYTQSQPCALARRDRCRNRTVGVDPQRVCADCQSRGQPARVEYEIVVGYPCVPQVIVLANAHMSEMAVHPAAEPKSEVGTFARA